MLDATTKRRIDDARDILVGKIPDPKSQVEQITIALIYKFMDDMDTESEELGGTAKFFVGDYKKYSWRKVFNKTRGGQEILLDYREALQKMSENPSLPSIFHTIFRQAYLPYNDSETLKEFLKIIDQFDYDHSEKLGDAFEYLLSVLGSQGDAGQFRTPRHIIDFMVDIVEPKKNETILDPACGTAGFLISSYKHILKSNSSEGKSNGDLLTPDERRRLSENISGYDISPDMVRLSLVNMYLHRITEPKIVEYDTLTSDTKWNEYFDVVLANPPFMSPKGGIKPHSRFSVQSKRSEALFVDYIAEHLTTTGRGAVIVPEGVIFKSDTAFTKLRKMLVEDNYLYGVISLPSGVFNPYSGVKTSILLFDKVISKLTDKILFAKVENDGFALGAQRRPIEGSQLDAITSTIKEFRIQLHRGEEFTNDICTLVDKTKIAESGDYNLSGERYCAEITVNSKFRFVSLGDTDLFDIQSGGTPDSKNESFWNGNVNWTTLVDLPASENVTTISRSERTITEEGLRNSSAKLLPVESVLVSSRATIGRIAINNIETATNQGFKNIVIKDKSKVYYKYVAYAMTHLRSQMESLAIGGTFKEISKSNFMTLKIPLPLLQEQRAIVAEIEGYQRIIDAARTIVDNYRPQITINPDWQIEKLGKVCDIISGHAFKSDDFNDRNSVKSIKITNIGVRQFIVTDSDNLPDEFSTTYDRFSAREGDIAIALTRPYISEGLKICKIPNEYIGALLNQRNAILRVKKGLLVNEYLYCYMNSQRVIDYIQEQSKSLMQPNLSPKDLALLPIPLPDFETQKQIVTEIEREQAAVDSAKELIEIFTKKITTRIAQIWNE